MDLHVPSSLIGCVIGFVPRPGDPSFGLPPPPSYPPDGEGSGSACVYIDVIQGSIEAPRQVVVTLSTDPVSAQGVCTCRFASYIILGDSHESEITLFRWWH